MLHIAPELCFIGRFEALENLDYITADIESPLAKVKMDIHEIPFNENSFDVIFCNHVLEHVDDDLKAMEEMYRVLKPEGWAILQVPFFPPIPKQTISDPSIPDPKERERLFGQDDHVRLYGEDYPDRLRSAGFNVIEIPPQDFLTDEQITRSAVMTDEVIYLVKVPGA